MAKERDIEKFSIYSLQEFLHLIKYNEKETNMQKKIEISLRGLKRRAIENITQINVEILSEKVIDLLDENKLKKL